MITVLQIILVIAFCLGVCDGYYKLKPPTCLSSKEPDIYFIYTDLFKK
jgi:hypothetical protein